MMSIMVRRERGQGAGDGASGLEEAADALYAVPPAEFIAARDNEVRAAKERGDREGAQWLAALRRPTTSAWLVNLLYRHQREAVEELMELGGQLTEAARQLSGPELQQLSAQRSQVVQALVATTRRLAAEAGVTVNAATAYEVQSTLGAALADPDVADQVRSGRMLRPASYAGFGPEPDAVATPIPDQRRSRTKDRPPPVDDPQESQRRARAEEQVASTQALLEDVASQLAERESALAEARELCHRLASDHGDLVAQLADLEGRQSQAAERASTAERNYRKAAARRDQAGQRLDQAQQRLRELG